MEESSTEVSPELFLSDPASCCEGPFTQEESPLSTEQASDGDVLRSVLGARGVLGRVDELMAWGGGFETESEEACEAVAWLSMAVRGSVVGLATLLLSLPES